MLRIIVSIFLCLIAQAASPQALSTFPQSPVTSTDLIPFIRNTGNPPTGYSNFLTTAGTLLSNTQFTQQPIAGSGGVTGTAYPLQTKGQYLYDIHDYNVTCNQTADDTVALQAAITAAGGNVLSTTSWFAPNVINVTGVCLVGTGNTGLVLRSHYSFSAASNFVIRCTGGNSGFLWNGGDNVGTMMALGDQSFVDFETFTVEDCSFRGRNGAFHAGGAFTTASPNITMAVSNTFVQPGALVIDVTASGTSSPYSGFIGYVSSWSGTQLVLTGNPTINSVGSSDNLEFWMRPAIAIGKYQNDYDTFSRNQFWEVYTAFENYHDQIETHYDHNQFESCIGTCVEYQGLNNLEMFEGNEFALNCGFAIKTEGNTDELRNFRDDFEGNSSGVARCGGTNFAGYISGTTLTVTSVTAGFVQPNQVLYSLTSGLTTGTAITSCTGSSPYTTCTVNNSQTFASAGSPATIFGSVPNFASSFTASITSGVASASVNAGGSGYTATQTGTMTWAGANCSVNPVLNVSSNGSGVIAGAVTIATAGACTTYPSNSATTWTASASLGGGSGATFNNTENWGTVMAIGSITGGIAPSNPAAGQIVFSPGNVAPGTKIVSCSGGSPPTSCVVDNPHNVTNVTVATGVGIYPGSTPGSIFFIGSGNGTSCIACRYETQSSTYLPNRAITIWPGSTTGSYSTINNEAATNIGGATAPQFLILIQSQPLSFMEYTTIEDNWPVCASPSSTCATIDMEGGGSAAGIAGMGVAEKNLDSSMWGGTQLAAHYTAMDFKGTSSLGNLTLGVAAPTTGTGQIGYGGTTAAASNCGSLASSAGCIVLNVAGTTRYVPYY